VTEVGPRPVITLLLALGLFLNVGVQTSPAVSGQSSDGVALQAQSPQLPPGTAAPLRLGGPGAASGREARLPEAGGGGEGLPSTALAALAVLGLGASLLLAASVRRHRAPSRPAG